MEYNHWRAIRDRAFFDPACEVVALVPMPLAKGIARESVSAIVAVSSTASAPNKANVLRFMSPSPD
jgi:hypothetical protein